MATQVIMPKLSPTMEEGQLTRWLKKEGDKVSMGEPLAEIDTDKATMEMQALGNGVLRKILIKEGESAPLGQLIAIIGEPDEDISGLEQGSSAQARPPGDEPSEAKSEPASPADVSGQSAPPTVRHLNKSLESKAGQGASAEPAVSASGNGSRSAKPEVASSGRLIVSPLAARMAAEVGVDLRLLNGTGPGGRIVKRDIEAAMSQSHTAGAAAPMEMPQRHLRAVENFPSPQAAGPSPYRDEPASEIRRTIARRLVTSLGPIPHFFLTTEVEMERAAEMRRAINELDPDLKVTLNDIIIKVAAAALMAHPAVNSSFQDKTVRYYERADIGVAVAVEDGLITPVVRSADRKSLGEIAGEVRELAERARHRKLRPDEYTGATFSISNLGMFGIDEFTAVINPPEGAIMAIGAMSKRPVVRDEEIVVRQMMKVTMSCDHRVIDGATGAKYLQTFKKILENPLYLVV
ncbi:MAG: pyruvate dehydrogenase complex dihydrolipoamide acetyltransferase [Pyrinomonadaceae bacterium]|nr:pyruvate dehydrogenase complex dihydrolipoamide acetyltransferase [Pyrinomonadaceae bacterium]